MKQTPRYLDITALRVKLNNRSRASIYRDIAKGHLPEPHFKLGNTLYWVEQKVDEHIAHLMRSEREFEPTAA